MFSGERPGAGASRTFGANGECTRHLNTGTAHLEPRSGRRRVRRPISHEVKCHIECCNRTTRFRYPTQSPVAPASYANPYAAYKLREYHDAKSRVSERPEKDYTQGLI